MPRSRGPIDPTRASARWLARAPHSNGSGRVSCPARNGENVREKPRESVMGNEMEMSSVEMPPPTLLADPQAKEWEYLTHGSIVVERNDGFWPRSSPD